MEKQRDSNFELLRIVAMMLVMLVHANYLSLGNVSQCELQSTPVTGFVRIFCEQLSIVSVNLFVLLSGWFGIRPTLKKFASLIFQIFFIGLATIHICRLAGVEVSSKSFSDFLYLGASYWFVPAYLVLFCLAPVLNAYCAHAEKRDFRWVLISFFVMESLFGWLAYDYAHFEKGYSAISFVGLYLLSQYIRRHGDRLRSLKWWQTLLCYLLFTIVPALIAFVGIYTKNKELGATAYSSMFVIAASVSLLLLFEKLHFQSKVINWLASSAFAIYLVHQAPGMTKVYCNFFNEAYQSMNGWLFIPFAILATTLLGVVSILFDKVRIVAWELLLKIKSFIVK